MARYILYTTLLASLMLLYSCRERIDMNLNSAQSKLVIGGYIATEPGRYTITVTGSGDYFGQQSLSRFEQAEVSIDGVALTSDPLQKGHYHTEPDFSAIPGRTYQLEVKVDFDNDGQKELYSATTRVPQQVNLLSMMLAPATKTDPPKTLPMIGILIFNDPKGANYYGAHLYISSAKDSTNQYKKYQITNSVSKYFLNLFGPEVEDGSAISFPAFMISRKTEVAYRDTLVIFPLDTVTLELNSLDEPYFCYLDAAQASLSGQNPLLAKPPGIIPGNISGGALGCFGSYTISRRQQVVKYDSNTWTDEQMERRFGVAWREIFK